MNNTKSFTKQTKRPLTILYTNPVKSNPKAYFRFQNKRYYLTEAIRTHGNPWIADNYPDYIHAYITDWFGFRNLYIEICQDDKSLNIYKETTDTDR